MKTPLLTRCAAFLAASLLARPAFGQSGGYNGNNITYPSGPLTSLFTSGYIRVQVPLQRTGHSFTLKWQTTQGGSVTSGSTYYSAFVTAGQVTNGNAAGQLQSFLVTVQTPYPTYTYTPYTYTSGGYTYTTYTYTQVPFSAYEWWLTDSTAGQDSQHQLGTPNANLSVLSVPWTQQSGQPSRYFAIPESRRGHSFGMRDGAWTAVSASPNTLNTYSNGASGSVVPLGFFVGSVTGPITSSTAYLGDLSTGERTNDGATDVRGTTPANGWFPDQAYAFYPMLDTHVTLHGRELGHKFAVHYKASNTPPLSRVYEAVKVGSSVRLDFQVGTGLPFWITREAENGAANQPVAPTGASVAGSTWVANTNGATFSGVTMFPAAPARPAGVVVPRLVRVNAIERSLHSFRVRQGDGYSVTYDAGPSSHSDPVTGADISPYAPGFIDIWSGQPVATPLPVHIFTAQVDNRFSVTGVRDEITGEELVPVGDGPIDWVAPWVGTSSSAPVGPTVTLQLPFTRASYISFDATRFARPDLANPATGMPYTILQLDPATPPNPTVPAPFTFSDSPPITEYTSEVFSVTLLNPTPNVPGSFPLLDLKSGDPTPIAVTAGPNDRKTWFTPPGPVALQISSSRWDHVLRVCHPNGESFPVERVQMQAAISEGPGGTVYLHPYYYFTANAVARAEMPWYLEDRSTDPVERILSTGDNQGPTNDELIVWYHLPTPRGLTGALSAGRRRAELVWAPAGASPEGAFSIERQVTGETGWSPIDARLVAEQGFRDGLFHFEDAILTVGKAHSYRVRYVFGGEFSDYSNPIRLTGWEDTEPEPDGLPDAWEMANFGSLSQTATGDADGDGRSNALEFAEHTNPNALSANAPGSTLIVYTPLQ